MDSAPVLMFVQVVGHNTSLSNLFQAGIVILYCTLNFFVPSERDPPLRVKFQKN